jgi:hypothetical protein
VTGDWQQLRNEELHNLHSSRNGVLLQGDKMKENEIDWNVTLKGEMRNFSPKR